MVTFDQDVFQNLSDYIDKVDYSSYTLQYPPVFLGQNNYSQKSLLWSFWDHVSEMGLYIHIPFCTTKCTFCRYFSYASSDENLYDDYVQALKKEIDIYVAHLSSETQFTSLYIGWGTPNILSAELLEELLSYIFSNFDFSEDYQFCIEINPHESTQKKLDIIQQFWCHRLTIGIQSLDLEVLSNINRQQTVDEVTHSILYAKEIGIPYINVDLMLGIKWQSLSSFLKDLNYVISLKPHMIHLHPFCPTDRTIDDVESKSEYHLQKLMEKLGTKLLQKYGYGDSMTDAMWTHQNADNKQLSDATNLGKYLGIGVSAVSFNGMYRWINTNSTKEYIQNLQDDTLAIKFASKLTKEDNMRQYIIYNMRYKKVDIWEFKKLFWVDLLEIFSKELDILRSKDIVSYTTNEVNFYFHSVHDYMIYSKIFYNTSIIQYFTDHVIQKQQLTS